MQIRKKFMLGCLAIAVLCMSACGAEGSGTDTGNELQKPISIFGDGNTPPSEWEPFSECYEPQPVFVENLREWNEAVRYVNVEFPNMPSTATYQIKSVEFTKEIGDHDKNQIHYDCTRAEYDEKGNLIGDDYVFLWLKMEAFNQSDEVNEDGVNFPLCQILPDNYGGDVIAEAVYISYCEENRPSKERFCYRYKPGERREYEIGYLMRTDSLKGELYYVIGYTGSAVSLEGNKFLRLEDFWKDYQKGGENHE